jgi:membrane protein
MIASIRKNAHRVEKWWTEDLWTLSQASKPPIARESRIAHVLRQLGIHAARSIYIVVTGFRKERIKLRASQLTYVSLLSFVPAIVVVFSLFSLIGGLGDIEDWVKRFVIASFAVSQQDVMMKYVDSFLRASGTVGGFGIAFLFVTCISLLSNIERAFNDIWGLSRHRTYLQRFQVYWPLITIGPILLGLSLSLTAAFEANRIVAQIEHATNTVGFGVKTVPFLLTVGWLTLLYMLLPNTRVPFRCAIIGGMVAGLLWEAAKQLYAAYAAFILSRPSIYGSLAAVPLFILWLYVSWVLALLGATLAFAVQNAKTYEPEGVRERTPSQHDRELLAVRLIVLIAESFESGKGPVYAQALLDRIKVGPRFARAVLAELVEAKLVVETIARTGEEAAYVPARPIESLTMADVVQAMRRGTAKSEINVEGDPVGERASEKLEEAEHWLAEALGTVSLAELIAREKPTR